MQRSFGKMQDLTVLSGDSRFDVHKAVLALASPVSSPSEIRRFSYSYFLILFLFLQ